MAGSAAKAPRITIGCDPEVFVRDKKTQQFIFPGGMVPGDKRSPHRIEGGAVQVDGFALEYNVDPVVDPGDFSGRNHFVFNQLKAMVPKEYEVVIQPSATFEKDMWKGIPRHAKTVGCDPDFNAYTKQRNYVPDGFEDKPIRFAGGHIHIGWTKDKDPFNDDHFEDCCTLVKELDLWLGIPSFVWDADPTRRSFYGKLGNFRPKPYGVEYRSLSNMWLGSEYLMNYVASNAYFATINAFNGVKLLKPFVPDDEVLKVNLDSSHHTTILQRARDIGYFAMPSLMNFNYSNIKLSKKSTYTTTQT